MPNMHVMYGQRVAACIAAMTAYTHLCACSFKLLRIPPLRVCRMYVAGDVRCCAVLCCVVWCAQKLRAPSPVLRSPSAGTESCRPVVDRRQPGQPPRHRSCAIVHA